MWEDLDVLIQHCPAFNLEDKVRFDGRANVVIKGLDQIIGKYDGPGYEETSQTEAVQEKNGPTLGRG